MVNQNEAVFEWVAVLIKLGLLSSRSIHSSCEENAQHGFWYQGSVGYAFF